MNKAITEGLDLMPPAFIDGLDVWSNENGTPGSTTYDTVTAGTLVASDPDFGTCLELIKEDSPQKLRHTGETPILPGCYLEVTARVKAVSGPFPRLSIATFAGDAGGASVGGQVITEGPETILDSYGRIYTIRAIIGSGDRTGVDLVWGTHAVFGHMGLNVRGDNGSVIRIESVEVRDMTAVFHRDLMDWVDVRDYGAIGDGITNDTVAFETADAAANGRQVMVSAGTYFLAGNVTMLSRCRFEGTILQNPDKRFILRSNFDFPSYADAFGDEETALRKAIQALFNFSDHESLDLGGRRIQLQGPIDIAEAVPNLTNFGLRRAIRNGQLEASANAAWDPNIVVANADYNVINGLVLTNVTNIGSIEVGSLVEGFGVGREVYVREKDDLAGELTLSQTPGRAQSSQQYTFTRERYMLDFSGVVRINGFNIDDIEFLGKGIANCIMLPPDGIAWGIRDCWFNQPMSHAITSIHRGCNGISIDRNQFISADADELVQDRRSVGFNINTNDAKVRENRCVQFKHFGVFHGGGNLIIGNHFWQVDSDDEGERTAGIIFARPSPKSTLTGNYIDSMSIEVTNEHHVDPANGSIEFGTLTMTGNIFTATQVPDWFSFIVIKPTGNNQTINGISVTSNIFKNFGGTFIDKVEAIDTSNGSIDHSQTVNLAFHSNSFDKVNLPSYSPAFVEIDQTSTSSSWTISLSDLMPFDGEALSVESLVTHGQIETGSGTPVYNFPNTQTSQGGNNQTIRVNWGANVRGTVRMQVRSDLPV